MNYSYPLPRETKEIFTQKSKCSNLSLWLDRYVSYNFDKQKWELNEALKKHFLQNIVQNFQFNSGLIESYYKRWQAIVQSSPLSQTFTAEPEWRMVIGLGQTSILETSITLDRITGIPIIPGSALKGLACSSAMLFHLQETDRTEAENNEEFKKIFGTEKNQGEIVFLDAVPTKIPTLELDIMNNHYPDYYEKDGLPTPYQNPNPIYFLTLGNKTQFAFAVVGKDKDLVGKAKDWLSHGLSELGIGAKTSSGYGYLISE